MKGMASLAHRSTFNGPFSTTGSAWGMIFSTTGFPLEEGGRFMVFAVLIRFDSF